MSPSLGWLQAFLCAAEHLDYERAAIDLGISAVRIKLRVEKLEQWLCKILIMDQPIELSEGDGAAFRLVAREALKRFAATCSDPDISINGVNTAPRTKLISAVRLHDLEWFICLAKEGAYKRAADTLGCDVSTLHRSVKGLEKVTGHRLIDGRVIVRLTNAGEAFQEAATAIMKALNDFRAVIPDDYDPVLERIKNLHGPLKRRQTELRFMAARIASTGKKQRGRVRLADVNAALETITKAINEIEENLVPLLPKEAGADLGALPGKPSQAKARG